MIPWTSSTHNFHFVAAFWFTHTALSCASTVSPTVVCVSDPLKFDPSTPFQSKSTHSRGVPVGSTHLHRRWVIEAQSTGTGNWSWNTRVESIVSFRWDPGTRGYHHITNFPDVSSIITFAQRPVSSRNGRLSGRRWPVWVLGKQATENPTTCNQATDAGEHEWPHEW